MIIGLLVRCALYLSTLTIGTTCVFYLSKPDASRTVPKRIDTNERRMRIPVGDLPNASRAMPSFRSRSPSFEPTFRDLRNRELDVQHIVLGLLERARQERDDPKFAESEAMTRVTASGQEECPHLLTASFIGSELSSEIESEQEVGAESDIESESLVESVDDTMQSINDQSTSHSLTVHRCTSGRLYPNAHPVESFYLSPLMQSEMEFRYEKKVADTTK